MNIALLTPGTQVRFGGAPLGLQSGTANVSVMSCAAVVALHA